MRLRLLGAVLLCASAAVADVIVRTDGTRLEGRVTSCDDEVCSIDKRLVEIAAIARILFRADVKIPPAARAGAVVLNDGTIRRGKFIGITLGYVELEGQDIERSEVAAVLFTDPALSEMRPPARDVLVDNGGTTRVGTLTTCNAASCTFDSETVPRSSIRLIGLAQEGASPPAASGEDRIFFAGREPVASRMSGVDAATVRTTRGSFPRAEVTWIAIAPPATPQPGGGGGGGAAPPPSTETPAQTGRPGTGNPPANPSPPTPPATPSPSSPTAPGVSNWSTARRGGLWTGVIRTRFWGNAGGAWLDVNTSTRVRMREWTLPLVDPMTVKRIGDLSILRSENTTVEGSTVMVADGVRCSGQGRVTITADENGPQPSAIYSKTTDQPIARVIGTELERGTATYHVAIETTSDHRYTVSCGSHSYEAEYMTGGAGWLPIMPRTPLSDPTFRLIEGGRMSGSFNVPFSGNRFAVTWSICREDAVCPPPPPLPDDGEAQPADPRDKCAQLASLIRKLRELRDAYERYEADLVENRNQRDAVRDQIWGAGGALSEFFVAMLKIATKSLTGAAKKALDLGKVIGGMDGSAGASEAYDVAKALGFDPQKVMQDAALSAAEKTAVKAAVQAADNYLRQHPGDHSGALRVYANMTSQSEKLASLGKTLTKGMGAAGKALGWIKDVKAYYDKTSSLFDLVQDWIDYNRNVNLAQSEMDGINAQMAEIQAQIDQLRREIEGDCPPVASVRPPSRFRLQHQAPAGGIVLIQGNVQRNASKPPDAGEIASRLKATADALDQVPGDLELAIPWLLPFILESADGASPELMGALLNRAGEHLEPMRQKLELATSTGETLEKDLTGAIPPKEKEPKPSGSRPGGLSTTGS